MSSARRPFPFVRVATLIILALVPAFSRVARAEDPAPVTFVLNQNTLIVPTTVTYATGSDAVLPESAPALAHVAAYLAAKSYISLMRVEVHSDTDGNAAEQQALTERRALAVARALVAQGVDCKRLIPVGFGGSKPVAANDTPDDKALNRRTVFVNVALRGTVIGGMPADGGGKVAGDPC